MNTICHDHIKYLKKELEPDDGYPHQELYGWNEEYLKSKPPNKTWKNFNWKDRYASLNLSTQFFSNIVFIDDLIHYANSIYELFVRVDLLNIPIEVLNFAVCYCYMCPGRWFSQDWRDLDDPAKAGFTPPFSSMQESIAWHIYSSLYKDITNRSLPMVDVECFKTIKLNA